MTARRAPILNPMRTIRFDLRSDTVTRPSVPMKRAMMEAPLGDDVLGDDPTVRRLEEEIARLTGKEAGLFFPSGTQANQAAIHSQTRSGDEVLVERKAHIFNHEGGAPAVLSGVQLHPVETIDGSLRPEHLEPLIRPNDPHFPQTRLVCVENTHNGHGGRIIPVEEMEELSVWVRSQALRVHLDGARLFNAVVAARIPAAQYAACADTVSVCLSKGLGAPVGTCLAGDCPTIDRARWARKRWGGGMRQAGIVAAAGLYALENNIERLSRDHRLARGLAEAVSGLPGVEVDVEAVQTNMILINVECSASELTLALADQEVAILSTGPHTLRAVTHLDLPPDSLEEIPRRLRKALDSVARTSRARAEVKANGPADPRGPRGDGDSA